MTSNGYSKSTHCRCRRPKTGWLPGKRYKSTPAIRRWASHGRSAIRRSLPYKSGTPVVNFTQTNTTQYVRVYTEGVTNAQGKWLMKYSDIQGLTAKQIQSKFALPHTPTHYCYVSVPSGTSVYVGIVGENYGFTAGQAVQFELMDTISPSCFGSGVPIS